MTISGEAGPRLFRAQPGPRSVRLSLRSRAPIDLEIWDAERAQVRLDYDAAIKKWRDDQDKAKASGARPSPSPGVPDALRDYRIASSIYDGMIAPLMPFAIKGAMWYQGESNEARAEQSKQHHPRPFRYRALAVVHECLLSEIGTIDRSSRSKLLCAKSSSGKNAQ